MNNESHSGLEPDHLDTPLDNEKLCPVVSRLILTKANFYLTF